MAAPAANKTTAPASTGIPSGGGGGGGGAPANRLLTLSITKPATEAKIYAVLLSILKLSNANLRETNSYNVKNSPLFSQYTNLLFRI